MNTKMFINKAHFPKNEMNVKCWTTGSRSLHWTVGYLSLFRVTQATPVYCLRNQSLVLRGHWVKVNTIHKSQKTTTKTTATTTTTTTPTTTTTKTTTTTATTSWTTITMLHCTSIWIDSVHRLDVEGHSVSAMQLFAAGYKKKRSYFLKGSLVSYMYIILSRVLKYTYFCDIVHQCR